MSLKFFYKTCYHENQVNTKYSLTNNLIIQLNWKFHEAKSINKLSLYLANIHKLYISTQ